MDEPIDSGTVTLPPLFMLLIDPQLEGYNWAIVKGGVVEARGKLQPIEEIQTLVKLHCIADVFIDEGFRSEEVRRIAAANRWHCVRARANKRRDGLAEMIERACA